MAAQTHSPLPWRVNEPGTLLLDANDECERNWTPERRVANRRFVSECVNSHHALVAERDALRATLNALTCSLCKYNLAEEGGCPSCDGDSEQVRAALALGSPRE